MPPFDESCVLIPTSTLEDFPSRASDYDARSLLAGWTVLWHPELLAQTEQLPAWYRADGPPDPPGSRLIVVPEPSRVMLPANYEETCRQTENCRWITGGSRAEMLAALELGGGESSDAPRLRASGRVISCEDFFAVGYVMLQIQIMTRRLRYTSNLDELRVQERVVAAAKAFVTGDGEAAVDALHDAFDSLAEERDHYFASDPSLIDLTLLVPSMVGSWADSLQSDSGSDTGETEPSEPPPPDSSGPLETPRNVLIDVDAAEAIGNLPSDSMAAVRSSLQSPELGWAGGGPRAGVCFATCTFNQAERELRAAFEATTSALGTRPAVYGRYSGASPVDLTGTLEELGFKGLIPIDFAHGSGFGDEAKVIRQSGSVEIEALTAKPIDAASDAAFLDLAPRLGEAIDGGEIATGLLVHWPGKTCESFEDVRRAASWSLVLGRFWRLEDYFVEGEHPYHHEASRAVSPDAANHLSDLIASETINPISSTAAQFRARVAAEQQQILDGMNSLVSGKPAQRASELDSRSETELRSAGSTDESSEPAWASQFARLSGWSVEENAAESSRMLLVNASSIARRHTVTIRGLPPKTGGHVYKAERHGKRSAITVDVPAHGFTLVESGSEKAKKRPFAFLFGGETPIAKEGLLQNEFMEVRIDDASGGVNGVYSGAVRGNRFSLRLIRAAGKVREPAASTMKAQKLKVVDSSQESGSIEVSGFLLGEDDKRQAEFRLRYTLRCGSRRLEVSGELNLLEDLGSDPWTNYIAARAAVASEATSYRALVRDKVHRGGGRTLVAPLGLELDEPDRKLLIASHGLSFHRRVGDRFVDTLLAVKGEQSPSFRIDYGFDVRQPIATARSLIAPLAPVPLKAAGGSPVAQGWIVYSAPASILISRLDVRQRSDGKLAALVRVIQTRNDAANAVIRFCRDVEFALRKNEGPQASIPEQHFWDMSPDEDGSKVDCQGDQVKCPVGGHGVLDLLVVFSTD